MVFSPPLPPPSFDRKWFHSQFRRIFVGWLSGLMAAHFIGHGTVSPGLSRAQVWVQSRQNSRLVVTENEAGWEKLPDLGDWRALPLPEK